MRLKKFSKMLGLILGIMLIYGCTSKDIQLEHTEKKETSLNQKKLDLELEKNGIAVSGNCIVYVPDGELAIYRGKPIVYDSEENRMELVERLFPEYDNKMDEIQHVSSIWGESYKYIPSEEFEEKIQFTGDTQYFYIRTPGKGYLDKEAAKAAAENLVAVWFPGREMTEAQEIRTSDNMIVLSGDTELKSYNCKITSIIDGIPSAGFSIMYSGNDKLYTGEVCDILADEEGVYRCSSSTFLQAYEQETVYSEEQWLAPEDALELFLEVAVVNNQRSYHFDEITLRYVLVPIKNVEEKEGMQLVPVWYLNDSEQNFQVAVDAINGELYPVYQ